MRKTIKDVFGKTDLVKPYSLVTGHKSISLYNSCHKWKCGPGGINCTCCTPIHPRKLKVKTRRYFRRKQKQSIFDERSEETYC